MKKMRMLMKWLWGESQSQNRQKYAKNVGIGPATKNRCGFYLMIQSHISN